MKKVFVVTSGEYSDYGIDAVFSSKELAEKYIKFKSRVSVIYPEYARIEEYTLDELPTYPLNKNHYLVILELETGNLLDIDLTDINSDKDLYFFVFNKFNKNNQREIWIYCWAEDEEHAKKIAYDIRTKVLAERENL